MPDVNHIQIAGTTYDLRTEATHLNPGATIDGVTFTGESNIHHYGVCATAADVAAKVVYVAGFALAAGARAEVKFSNANTAANPTLNVSSTGAKPIRINGGWNAGDVIEFSYDGTNWVATGGNSVEGTFTVGNLPALTAKGMLTDTSIASSALSALLANAVQIRDGLSLSGTTPDNVEAKPSYYISAGSVTQRYTGVYVQSVFVELSTPAGNHGSQFFFLPDGRIFGRNGNSGDFTCVLATSISTINDSITTINDEIDAVKDNVNAIESEIGGPVFVRTIPNEYLYTDGTLAENQNFSVHEYDVSELIGLSILCNTTLYGTTTCWGFFDESDAVITVQRGTGTGVYAQEITAVVPQNAKYFRVTERVASPAVTFYVGINNLAKAVAGLTGETAESSGLFYSSSPSEVVSGASDSVGGAFNLYLPYSSEKHIKVAFIRTQRGTYDGSGSPAYHNGDGFRLEQGILGTITSGAFSAEETIITDGAWEAAIYKNNTGSAVGTFHGWEKFSRCIIQVNGNTVADLNPLSTALPSISMSKANAVDILYWAEVYEMPATGVTTETKLLDAFRRYHIEGNTITLTQRNTWVPAGTHGIFVAMGCVSRALTDRALCDYDYVLYDISNQNETAISGSSNAKSGVSYAREFGLNTDVSVEITVDPPCNFYVQNTASASYNKLYFRYVKETTAGEHWDNQTTFVLGN